MRTFSIWILSGKVLAMFGPVLFTLIFYVSGALTGMLGPCKKEDAECFAKTVNEVTPIVYSGIPSLGVPSSDPLSVDLIEGNLSVLKYKFTNTTVRGFKDCTFKNINLNVEAQKLYYEMDCPSIAMSGNYEIKGRLILLPVEGQGTFEIITTRYLLKVDSEIKAYKNNGKTFITIKNFKLKPQALGPIKFHFDNLFNGRKELSDAVHKFADENWNEVADLVQDPIFKKDIKMLISNYNKFLKYEALEDIFID